MNTTKYLKIAGLALAITLMTACVKTPEEESIFLNENQVAQLIADDGGKLYTINELLDKYMTEKGNFMSDKLLYRTRATNGDGIYLFSLDSMPTTGGGIYIRGRVTTDDYGGNFYKTLCIQQVVNGEQQALRISVDGSSVSGMYPLGQEILIRCNGLFIGRYADQPQLCIATYNNNYTASNASQKVGWAPGRITWERFQQAVKRIGKPDLAKLHYDVLKITDFTSITDEKTMRYWDGKLVRLDNVYFTGQYLNTNNTPVDCDVADPKKNENANVYAPTTKNIGYPQSRVISDGTNITLVSNSEYAKHAYYYLPGADMAGCSGCSAWKGSITGILGQYRDNAKYAHDFGDWSITIRDLSDLNLTNGSAQYYPDNIQEFQSETGL